MGTVNALAGNFGPVTLGGWKVGVGVGCGLGCWGLGERAVRGQMLFSD